MALATYQLDRKNGNGKKKNNFVCLHSFQLWV